MSPYVYKPKLGYNILLRKFDQQPENYYNSLGRNVFWVGRAWFKFCYICWQ